MKPSDFEPRSSDFPSELEEATYLSPGITWPFKQNLFLTDNTRGFELGLSPTPAGSIAAGFCRENHCWPQANWSQLLVDIPASSTTLAGLG